MDYIVHGNLHLPCSTNQYIRSVWNDIQCNSYPLVDVDDVLWNDRPHSVKLVYMHLHNSDDQAYKWSKVIWTSDSKPGDNMMLWKVLQNALLTRNKLMEMGFDSGFTCVFCANEPETVLHLILQCPYTKILFDKMVIVAGRRRLAGLSMLDFDMLFKATRWRTVKARYLTICLKKYLAVVWYERNMICFEKKRRDEQVLWKVLKNEIYKALKMQSNFTVNNLDAWR